MKVSPNCEDLVPLLHMKIDFCLTSSFKGWRVICFKLPRHSSPPFKPEVTNVVLR
ncbi:hypothetical protein HOLleu_02457 [Holothuria leucospilota]|uniref:Uncharacterized protein n=1 Tax=Holothuria leucospilota TaxID=206669 RepID=A0A9Q1CRN4_HOLLE|nr:hypothetical protein HOLleu_02457 [Holothuria leucospilota]